MASIEIIRDSFLSAAARYVQIVIATLPILLLLRFYEFIAAPLSASASAGVMLQALGNDLFFALAVGALAFLLYFPLFLASPKLAEYTALGLGWLAIVSYAGLIQFYITASVPLGSDLFGYSWKDIAITVSSSGGIHFFTIFLGLVLSAGVLALLFFSKHVHLPRRTGSAILLLCFVSILPAVLFKPVPQRFASEAEYQVACNKAEYFLEKAAGSLTTVKTVWTGTEFPLFTERNDPDVLGPFFSTGTEKPNLVFIIVEGLGRTFVGPNALHGGFTPFLDSLAGHSLFWQNFLSTSGRTFCVLPSMFGSLPYGNAGFMELGDSMPAHQTLIRLLKDRGYRTSFFYGGSPHFDMQDLFLEKQHIDFMLDEFGFGPGYSKMDTMETGFTWGFSDGDLFNRSLELIRQDNAAPRLDIYLTLSTHEPFLVPRRQYYEDLRQRIAAAEDFPAGRREEAATYHAEFSGILYTDDALRQFFSAYRKRHDYSNTIFFITGDHRMNPIPQSTAIDRFRVPMIIYSPMLRAPASFASVSSHRDITPTMIAFLRSAYGMEFPQRAHWLGDVIDTCRTFRNVHALPFMRTKNNLVDFLDSTFFLADGRLFSVRPDLDLTPVNNESMAAQLRRRLEEFRTLNTYVCKNNRLMPAAAAAAGSMDSLPTNVAALHLGIEELFQRARQKAFEKNFSEARAICRFILQRNPNDHDAHTLLARTFAWDGQYDTARTILKTILQRAPFYRDAAVAIIDVDTWSGELDRAFRMADSIHRIDPKDKDIAQRRTALSRRVSTR
ncbi:MAG: sulfatase-like hydrolase/transferase [Ignavibacteriales bacterium]|nr:sulfatase-like hydrolase/transferase [Ignavibacteriales bacterium]